MPIDFDSFFRNRVEGLLIRASWVGEVRRMLGLTGVSQVWDGQAAWYFWLQAAVGEYGVFEPGAAGGSDKRRRLPDGMGIQPDQRSGSWDARADPRGSPDRSAQRPG
jgi:hypothetical protein